MKNVFRWGAVFVLPLLLLMVALPHDAVAATSQHVAHFTPHMLGLGAIGIGLSQSIPVLNLGIDDLTSMAKPGQSSTNCLRGTYYDTQTATGAANQVLTYYQAISTDVTLSNVKGNGGIMPNNYFFRPLWINADFMSRATLAAGSTQVGIADDIQQLLWVGRATLLLTLGSLRLPEIPLSYCHASGGAIGSIGATLTAPNAVQFANNGAQDSGYYVGGSFLLSPMAQFKAVIQFSGTAVTLAANLPIRLSMDGDWYQPVQ